MNYSGEIILLHLILQHFSHNKHLRPFFTECPENGSFLDTAILVWFFSKRIETRVHKPITSSMSN